MIAIFTWLPKSRAVALLILLMFHLNFAIGLADDQSTDDQIADDNILLSVNSMPLSVFASAVAEGMSISIEVDESIADFTIDGQFNGSIEFLLDDLYNRYGISHSVSDNVYKLWRDSDFSSEVSYQFQLSDMDLVSFLSYLSDAAGYQLVADTSIEISVDGAFNGTLRDTINALSHQYPILFYISEDTISVVPETSFVKSVVLLPEENYSPEVFLTDLRTKIPPGNFVNREDNQLIVGGHPDFVRRTELELQVDISNTALLTPELLTNKFPVISNSNENEQLNQSGSNKADNSAASTPLVLIDHSSTVAAKQEGEVAITAEQDDNVAVTSEEGTDVELTVEQNTGTTVTPGHEPESAALEQVVDIEIDAEGTEIPVRESQESVPELGEDVEQNAEQDAEVLATPEQASEDIENVKVERDGEAELTTNQVTEVIATPEQESKDVVLEQVGSVEQTAEQGAEVIATPEQESKEVVLEQDSAVEQTAEQGAEIIVTPEQESKDALQEQGNDVAVTEERETEIPVNSDSESAEDVVPELEAEVPATPQPNVDADGKATSEKTNADVGSVDQIPGFY